MTDAEPSSELALLRECQLRALDREGIPMVLALVSEVDRVPAVASRTAIEEGGKLAEQIDRVCAALAPSGRDGDMGRVVTVLQVASYADFGSPESQL